MTNISKRRKDPSRNRYKMINDHSEFLQRIKKSLYYGKLPSIPCLSLPVTELSAELFSEVQKGKSLKRLHVDEAAELTRNACVSPCSLVLALLYLERLKSSNPEYVSKMAPSELFLVSLMVSNKFLQDDGEEDEVFADEWATSAGVTTEVLHRLERNFLHAIDWRIFVNGQRFERALEWLEHQIALKQSRLRGWFTYADLTNITHTVECYTLIKGLVTVYIALSVSYLASISTLIASSMVASRSSLAIMNGGLLNGFVNHQSYSLEENLNITRNETDTDTISNIADVVMFENSLNARVTIQTSVEPGYFHFSNDLYHGNSSLNTIDNFKYDKYWACLYSSFINEMWRKMFDTALSGYVTQLKDFMFMHDDKAMEPVVIKDTDFTSKRWLSHWKHQDSRYYSMIGRFSEVMAIAC